MIRSGRTITLVLALALVLSVPANVLLFLQGRSFYLQLNALRLDPYELEAFPSSVSATNGPIVIVYGDSRAADWPVPIEPNDLTYINRGIASQTTAQVLGRFREHALDLEPDIILLQVGINDLKTIPLFPGRMNSIINAAFDNIDILVQMSLDQHVCVILTTVFPVGNVPLYRRPFWSVEVENARRILNEQLMTLASDRVTVLDFEDVFRLQPDKQTSQLYRDMLHLTPIAYEKLRPSVSRTAHRLLEHHACGRH